MLRNLVCLACLTPLIASAQCEEIVLPYRERIAAAIERMLLAVDDDDRLARLDADIVTWIEGRSRDFTPRQRENLLSVLENFDHVVRVRVPKTFGDVAQFEASGAVDISDDGPVLKLGIYEVTSEFMRGVIVHEIAHVLRMIVDGTLAECGDRAVRSIERPRGIYREEIYANRETYRYFRRHYDANDLIRLKRSDTAWEDIKTRLLAANLIEISAGRMTIHLSRVQTEEAAYLMRDFHNLNASEKLRLQLVRALATSEPQWVKQNVSAPYRAFQARRLSFGSCQRKVRKAVRRLSSRRP